jgi:hypothetical protein
MTTVYTIPPIYLLQLLYSMPVPYVILIIFQFLLLIAFISKCTPCLIRIGMDISVVRNTKPFWLGREFPSFRRYVIASVFSVPVPNLYLAYVVIGALLS